MAAVFYKYRTDSPYTESIFTTGEVFLSTASGLNDPFECSLQQMAKSWIEKQVKEMKQAAVFGFLLSIQRSIASGGNFFGLSAAELAGLAKDSLHLKDIDATYAFYAAFIQERTGHPPSDCERFFSKIDAQLQGVGIFSVSANPDNPLMWAHYAKDHTGICIGFRQETGTKLADQEHFLAVEYSDSLPAMEGNGLISEMSFSLDAKGQGYTSN